MFELSKPKIKISDLSHRVALCTMHDVIDKNGTIWVATDSGLSRIANGRVATLTTANGLPCPTVHWIIEDRLASYWLYTACGLVRACTWVVMRPRATHRVRRCKGSLRSMAAQ